MVKIKKKYKEFINESLIKRPILDDSRLSFIISRDSKQLIELRNDFSESVDSMTDFFPGFYSDMCKRTNAKPEGDYQEMQNLLDKKGWNFNSIKNLFSDECNKITGQDFFDWYNGSGGLDQKNGHCDVYLYFTAEKLGLDPNIISLGGEGWTGYKEPEELFIRYSYGYHQTEYGKLMLKQNGMTESEFIETALTQLHIHIKDNLYDVIWRFFSKKYEGTKSKDFIDARRTNILNLTRRINFEEISIIDSDRLIIDFIELSEILEEEVGVELSPDELVSSMVKFLSPLKLSYFVNDGDLVIKTKE